MKLTRNLQIINAISRAGRAILDIYESDNFGVEVKEDESPLTLADKAAHEILMETLETFQMPILSEEGKNIEYSERKKWNEFWLVDPLDGTKEFIKKNDEFTINVAHILRGEAYSGFVYAPVLGEFYLGINQQMAFKFSLKAGDEIKELPAKAKIIKATKPSDKAIVVASRSHFNDETKAFVKKLEKEFNEIEFISKGSSLKLVEVAEGKAHIYPRFGPTMEWDTAAAHAVVLAAGGQVITPEGNAVKYNKEDLLNPYFIVKAK